MPERERMEEAIAEPVAPPAEAPLKLTGYVDATYFYNFGPGSAFIHLCIDASKAAKANGGDFGLEKVHPEVAQVFRIAGLQSLLLSSQ